MRNILVFDDAEWDTYEGEMFGWTYGQEHTIRINHENCAAGTDNKRRLYITKTTRGTLLAFCHHCSGRAWKHSKNIPNIHVTSKDDVLDPDASSGIVRPYLQREFRHYERVGYTHDNPIFQVFYDRLEKYDIDWTHCSFQEWLIGETNGGACAYLYPITSNTAQVVKLRKDGSKHLHSLGPVTPYIYNPNDSNTLVICEDRLSGIKIAQAGYASCSLHGSKYMSLSDCHKLAIMYDEFAIWYDNDNYVVNASARKTYDTFKMLTDRVVLIEERADPKSKSEQEIYDLVADKFLEKIC